MGGGRRVVAGAVCAASRLKGVGEEVLRTDGKQGMLFGVKTWFFDIVFGIVVPWRHSCHGVCCASRGWLDVITHQREQLGGVHHDV